MPITLVATAGASNANAYCTLAEADAYHLGHQYEATWRNANDDEQNRAIVMATRLLDEHVDWHGSTKTDTQALLWPRLAVTGRNGFLLDNTVVPDELKVATAEFARQLLDKDRTADDAAEASGLQAVTAGPVSVTFKAGGAKAREVLPDSVLFMVNHLGRVRGKYGHVGGVVELLRA